MLTTARRCEGVLAVDEHHVESLRVNDMTTNTKYIEELLDCLQWI